MSAWFKLTAGLLALLILAACSDGNDNSRPAPVPPQELQETRVDPAEAEVIAGLATGLAAGSVDISASARLYPVPAIPAETTWALC